MKAKLGSGAKFAAMSKGVAASYMKKGVPAKKAAAIGKAVAAKAGIAKYGQKKMTKMVVAGKKK